MRWDLDNLGCQDEHKKFLVLPHLKATLIASLWSRIRSVCEESNALVVQEYSSDTI